MLLTWIYFLPRTSSLSSPPPPTALVALGHNCLLELSQIKSTSVKIIFVSALHKTVTTHISIDTYTECSPHRVLSKNILHFFIVSFPWQQGLVDTITWRSWVRRAPLNVTCIPVTSPLPLSCAVRWDSYLYRYYCHTDTCHIERTFYCTAPAITGICTS